MTDTACETCGGSGTVDIGVNEDFDTGMLEANDEVPCPDCGEKPVESVELETVPYWAANEVPLPEGELTEEDRQRLREMAESLNCRASQTAYLDAAERWRADAALLTRLADRGER